ncbi:hypothetical protein BD626DRAFT_541741 [Schizophyllum amplum]|uniref:GCN1-like HEAT repeats domain-containing protein n=1 Tax=Schizophyllum amplum TaxID=97359 RepID=A0A550BTL6_9AGAR|nr:hypothetical protein BD626DRAFT_541741 [Auriculariopsis ampla]
MSAPPSAIDVHRLGHPHASGQAVLYRRWGGWQWASPQPRQPHGSRLPNAVLQTALPLLVKETHEGPLQALTGPLGAHLTSSATHVAQISQTDLPALLTTTTTTSLYLPSSRARIRWGGVAFAVVLLGVGSSDPSTESAIRAEVLADPAVRGMLAVPMKSKITPATKTTHLSSLAVKRIYGKVLREGSPTDALWRARAGVAALVAFSEPEGIYTGGVDTTRSAANGASAKAKKNTLDEKNMAEDAEGEKGETPFPPEGLRVLVFAPVESSSDVLLASLLAASTTALLAGLPGAAARALAFFVASDLVVPQAMAQMCRDLDHLTLSSLTTDDMGVTQATIKGKDAEPRKWEAEVRSELDSPTGKGNAPARAKVQQAAVQASWTWRSLTKGVKCQLEHGLAWVSADVTDGAVRVASKAHVSRIVCVTLDGVLGSDQAQDDATSLGTVLMGTKGVDVYLVSVLIAHKRYRLRFLSKQTPLDAASFSYVFPLLQRVVEKGHILDDRDEAETRKQYPEQLALALDTLTFHATSLSGVVKKQSALRRGAAETLVAVGETLAAAAVTANQTTGPARGDAVSGGVCWKGAYPGATSAVPYGAARESGTRGRGGRIRATRCDCAGATAAFQGTSVTHTAESVPSSAHPLDAPLIFDDWSRVSYGEYEKNIDVARGVQWKRMVSTFPIPVERGFACTLAFSIVRLSAGWLSRRRLTVQIRGQHAKQRGSQLSPHLPLPEVEPCFGFLIGSPSMAQRVEQEGDPPLRDCEAGVRRVMLNAGIAAINVHGGHAHVLPPLIAMCEAQLAAGSGVVVLFHRLARHMDASDTRIPEVVDRLVDVLSSPAKHVQIAVSECLAPLVAGKDGAKVTALIDRPSNDMLEAPKYTVRRGSVYSVAGAVRGTGIAAIEKYQVMGCVKAVTGEKKRYEPREGAMNAAETLSATLGRAGGEAMAIELLGMMAYCAPKHHSLSLPIVSPRLTDVLTDGHDQVHSAAHKSLKMCGDVIPVFKRGLKERRAAQIVGNLASLIDTKDFVPYLNTLLSIVHVVLADPLSEARATAAKSLGTHDTEDCVWDAAIRAGCMVLTSYANRPSIFCCQSWTKECSIRDGASGRRVLFNVPDMSGKTSNFDEDDTGDVEVNVAESSRKVTADVLGRKRCDRILSALYIACQHSVLAVRTSSIQWKALACNTPRTARAALAAHRPHLKGAKFKQRRVAGCTLAETCRKFGERMVSKTLALLRAKDQGAIDGRVHVGGLQSYAQRDNVELI